MGLGECVRENGVEPERYYRSWGGKPSTLILRHRDHTIDAVTKARYHRFLSGHLSIQFPTRAEESADEGAADEVYQSAVKWLLNKTRDTKEYALLFKENVSYGFRRNSTAIRPAAISIGVASAVYPILSNGVITSACSFSVDGLAKISGAEWVSVATSLGMCAVWLVFFTEESVKRAAYTYAETLLRACDTLPPAQTASTRSE